MQTLLIFLVIYNAVVTTVCLIGLAITSNDVRAILLLRRHQ